MSEPTLTINGYTNSTLPLAYFAEAIQTTARPDQMAFAADAKTYTLALGARPSHALGLFVYANAFDTGLTLGNTNAITHTETVSRIHGRNQRVDVGAHYRFSPQSQAWFKVGQGKETSFVSTINSRNLLVATAQASDFETRPRQRDVQLRYTQGFNDRYEFSWGAELGDVDKDNTLLSEGNYHLVGASTPADRLVQHHARPGGLADCRWAPRY